MDAITIPNVGRCPTLRAVIACTLLTAGALTSGCVGGHALAGRPDSGLTPVAWFAPADVKEGAVLERWRGSVGPPVFSASRPTLAGAGTLTLVSWNTALGAGNVERLVTDLQRERPGVPIVLLLQEVYRGGPEVPTLLTRNAAYASRLRGLRSDGKRDEVETIASALQMSVYYVPSMRNGSPLTSDEDRGNAILSTLPLSDLTGIRAAVRAAAARRGRRNVERIRSRRQLLANTGRVRPPRQYGRVEAALGRQRVRPCASDTWSAAPAARPGAARAGR